jgi:hypothetical protein
VSRPYRDELEAMRARIDLLEIAARERVCTDCVRRRRPPEPRPGRPYLRLVLGSLMGLFSLGVLYVSYAALVHPSVPHVFR